MELGEPLFAPSSVRDPVSLEGVTCIVCHRVDQAFGKNSGRNALLTGDLVDPVYGPGNGDELRRVLDSPDEYRGLTTDPAQRGRRVHGETRELAAIRSSGFCGRCHDVTFVNGFRLEEAFSEYKSSPAAKRGESCQDCHMGATPGVASEFRTGPAALVGGVPTTPRPLSNHMFIGPDYSVVHPGIFPHHPDAKELATMAEWTEFDWRAGWGTEAFEQAVGDDAEFPPRWAWPDDRIEAREIVERQLALLAEADAARVELLRNGYRLGEVSARRRADGGLELDVPVRNGTDGHNVPTGFIAERLVFLRVTVTDGHGEVVFRSGDLDPNGDVRDLHSQYVHDGALPLDEQLFSLQSKFIVRNLRGGEQEQVLSINQSIDPLPFARPARRSNILTGRPDGARIHKQTIEPNGERVARYRIGPELASGAGPFTAAVELVAAMVPVNLVGAIADVGFDFGMSPRAVADEIVAGHRVLARWEGAFPVR
jgi:hypothetical protein